MKTLLIAVTWFACLYCVWSMDCLSCTYTFAGIDGSVDHECISDVYNFSRTRVINCTEYCTIKAVYIRGYARLNSLYRGCAYKFSTKNFCDHPNNIIPTCEYTCREPSCNDQNGDLWPSMKPAPKPKPDHGGGSSGGGGGSGNGSGTLKSSGQFLFILGPIMVAVALLFQKR